MGNRLGSMAGRIWRSAGPGAKVLIALAAAMIPIFCLSLFVVTPSVRTNQPTIRAGVSFSTAKPTDVVFTSVPAPPTNTIPPTNTPGPTNTPQATATKAPIRPTATRSVENQYLATARKAALPDIRDALGVPSGEWSIDVMNLGAGPETHVRMPLNPANSNEQFVRLAKQSIARVINALFVSDPALARVVVIGTFPTGQAGELPAVSIAVKRGSADWGIVPIDELVSIADFVDIKPRYR